MKKFLLFLSALFVGVSFATAQTSFEISPSNGDVAAGAKSCEWNYAVDNNPAGLKIVATDANGTRVNAISATTGTSRLKFSAGGAFEGTETTSSAPTTFTVSVNENYLITGFCMVYIPTSTNKITVSNEYGYNVTPSRTVQTMEKYDISVQSIKFNVSAITSPASYAAQVNTFTLYVQKVGGAAPVEYTVSAIAGVGGTVTVNGGTDAVTTTGEVALVAVPDYGYKFKNWTVGTEEVATTAEYTATVSSDTEFVANFEKLTDTNDWYASIVKPTFTQLGNTTFVNAATLTGGINAKVTGIKGGKIAENQVDQKCVTDAIEVAAGAEFDLNITYQLNWGDLAIYQIDNDGATKEYGYYFGSWEPNGSTAKVAQNIANEGISITEVVDGACTATFPITINENHNPGDVIVVRAITGVENDAKNSAFEQGISEGGYVDFLFVVAEENSAETWSSFYAAFPVAIPEGVEAYIVTAANGSYVTLTQIYNAVPANTGVILKGGSIEATYDNYYSGAVAEVTGNLLQGTMANTYISEEAYVLGKVDGEYGFYKAAMNQQDDTAWLANAGKAYLPVSALPASAQGAASFSFRFGEGTTGIEEVKTENGKVKAIFDLTGRKLKGENGNLKGVYIINGKKVLVK